MDSTPILLPTAPLETKRPPMPFVAALVPVAAGVTMWLVTGSLLSLCFAALGPLMLLASVLDARRTARRARRSAASQAAKGWAAAEAELSRRHAQEREERRHRHPDVAWSLVQPPLRGSAPDAATELVVGAGSSTSVISAGGGEDDAAREFRRRCSTVEDVPVTVELGGGIAIRGPAPLTTAVARALVLQLCLRFGVGQLAVLADEVADWGLAALPHARSGTRGTFRLGLARQGMLRPRAEAVIWVLDAHAEIPDGATTVMDLDDPGSARVRTPSGRMTVSAECISAQQAAHIVAEWSVEAEALDVLPSAIGLSELTSQGGGGLSAVIGRAESGDVTLDIVEDGPHAIVTGTTGTGKSELLVSWVAAMAREHGPQQLLFVLADFKGGTAFDPLRDLPQVVAVITDLDDDGARRGVSSLTAELRRREAFLAQHGARDITEVDLPRLVIVVDEFAALLQEHPDLGGVFVDIAARGRGLGMHLILGTQRAIGVIRDALAANCGLRVSLRVSDAADSRMMIGTPAAAELPGGASSRGLALVRRPHDAEPIAMRVGLTRASDLRSAAVRWSAEPIPLSPWLPALRTRIALDDLLPAATADALVWGVVDEPDAQAQPLHLIVPGVDRGLAVIGGPGSGRTNALTLLLAQYPGALWIPRDIEGAWDAVAALDGNATDPPTLVLCDDIDLQLAGLPAEYSQRMAQHWEHALRSFPQTTFVITAARAVGATARLLDALPARALLRTGSRVEHLAAGGDTEGFDANRPPGRARLGDREVQLAVSPMTEPEQAADPGASSGWRPTARVTALVTEHPRHVVGILSAAHQDCTFRELDEGMTEMAPTSTPIVLVGDAEQWQRQRTLFQSIRSVGEVLIRAENAFELRQLAGVRELPPYARLHAGRAWTMTAGSAPRRVVIRALVA